MRLKDTYYEKKNSKQLRTLSQAAKIHSTDMKTFDLMLPYC